MKKKCIVGILTVAAVLLCAIYFTGKISAPKDDWHHKTIQGKVADVWEENGDICFSVVSQVSGTVYNILIREDTLYCADFDVGDEVVVEVDYNIREHNGKDKPYIAAIVADSAVHDINSGLENS